MSVIDRQAETTNVISDGVRSTFASPLSRTSNLSIASNENQATSDALGTALPSSRSITTLVDFSLERGMAVFKCPLSFHVDSMRNGPQNVINEGMTLFQRAREQHSQGHHNLAQVLYQRAIDTVTSTSLSASPETSPLAAQVGDTVLQIIVPSLTNMGILAFQRKELDLAESYLDRAMIFSMRYQADDTIMLGLILNNLGMVMQNRATRTFLSESPTLADDGNICLPSAVVDSNSALFLLHEAYRILTFQYARAVGDDRPDASCVRIAIAMTCHNLGRVLLHRRDNQRAVVYLEMSTQLRWTHLGEAHVDTAMSTFLMGQAFHLLCDDVRALACYSRVVANEAFQRSKGHCYVIALVTMAEIHEHHGDFAAAQTVYSQSLVAGNELLSKSDLAHVMNRVARFYLQQNKPRESLDLYEQSLGLMKSEVGMDECHVIAAMLAIGEIHQTQKDFEAALKIYHEALDRQKSHYGGCSLQVASTLRTMGVLHDQQGDLDDSLNCFQESLVIRRSVVGDDALDVSDALTDVGSILSRSNKVHEALKVLTVAWEIRIKILGADHRHVSFSVCNIGVCHMLQGSYPEAISCFEESLRLELAVVGEYHQDVALTLNRLGDAHKKDGNTKAALTCLQRALKIERVVRCDEPEVIAATLNEIGLLYLVTRDVVSMMKSWVEAARLYRSASRDFMAAIGSQALPVLDLPMQPAAQTA